MLKRPKPGEDEDDLLEFQRQFLAEKSAPAATLARKPVSNNRDVVLMEGLPSKPPASDTQPSPMKKSRFREQRQTKSHFSASKLKEAQKSKSDLADTSKSHPVDTSLKEHEESRPQYTGRMDDDIIDEHERSTATVLAKIIEKDTRHGNYSLPAQVKLPFPAVARLDGTETQDAAVGARKKKSLFAQQFISNEPISSSDSPSQAESDQLPGVSVDSPHIIDGSGLSASFSQREAGDIHKENMTTLSNMSPDEILQEQTKLLQSLDPKLVEFLKKKKTQNITSPDVASGTITMDTSEHNSRTEMVKQEEDAKVTPPISVKSTWVNMDNVEHDKLQWMKDLPPPSADNSQTGTQARFDFQGQLLAPDADIPVNRGLHHHGDEPERAGYTLEELFTLSRSSNTQQRVLALQTLARVIKQAKEGNLAELVQTPVLPSIIDAGVVFLLRWALDDSVDAVMVAAVAALNSLLVNHADELCLDKVFHWYHGYRVASQAPVRHESVGIKLPGESEEKPQETDADVAKQDIILALVTRMNFLSRLHYILTSVRPQAPTVIAVLEILTRVARHSPNMANQVFSHKGLLEAIIKEFLPMSWNQDNTGSVSNVYGLPVREALRLILTLCQAGRNMAHILLTKFGLQERLLRYLLSYTSDSKQPDQTSQCMKLEALKVWKICLSYGLADTVYLDVYPRLVEELRTSTDVPEILVQEHLTALIGCVEMAVITAAHHHNKHAFTHRQDGSSMEVERSEEEAGSCLNWSHVADLIQPIRILLQNLLTDMANSYQIKKAHLQLCQACLNFVTTFYICAKGQLEKGYIVQCLSEMEDIFGHMMQKWDSIGFTHIRAQLSIHSNHLHHTSVTKEMSLSLPEYGNSSVMEEKFLPTVQQHSPYGFLTAVYRLAYNFAKIHRGLLTQTDQAVKLRGVLTCPDVWSYMKKVVVSSPAVQSFYNKFETHFQYYVLKLAAVVISADESVKLDRAILHHLCLGVLTSIQHGDEFLVHDLLSTVVFNQQLCSKSSEDPVSACLEDMHVSDQPSTHLQVMTSEQVDTTCQRLCDEACTCLSSIRASYMAALSHLQDQVLNSRRHFMQGNPDTQSCYTSHVGESLMPRDWMFLPLIELYNTYSTVGLEVQNVLSSSQLDMVRNVLRWVYLMEYNRTARLEGVSITLKISRIMCVFLTGNDMFLDRLVHCYLEGLLKLYTKPALLHKMNFDEEIPGLPSFYDLFVALLQQFEAVSFGDPLFACYVLIALQQRHSIQYRKALWTEYTGLLRTLSLPLNQLLINISEYLTPEEQNVELLRLYYQSLYSGTLRPVWSPVLYLMAVHHVNRFIYTQDGSHSKLKASMMNSLWASKNKEVCKHVIYYKMANPHSEHGIEVYTQLPPIRQTYVDSLKVS